MPLPPISVTAITAVSAMGRGGAAMLDALRARRSGLVPCDFAGVTNGFVGLVAGLDHWQLPSGLATYDCRNNRLADMTLRTDGFAEAVAAVRERYGPQRVAVVLGTSTSGILSTEQAYRALDPQTGALSATFDYDHTHDLFSLPRFVREALKLKGPALSISVACASSARSFVDAAQLIATGISDAAVVGGVDTLCALTLKGFGSLQLISDGPCRPCDSARSGISLGEAGGFALLEREDRAQQHEADRPSGMRLLGFGTTSDGHHMSSPDPEGHGARGAMERALAMGCLRPEDVDYVNLHGTGTRANDAMEDRAVSGLFGIEAPCSSTKGWSGHTLGAAGVLEAAIASTVLSHSLVPGCLNVNQVDPTFQARVVTENLQHPIKTVLSNSFGFGGVNCSLLFGTAA